MTTSNNIPNRKPAVDVTTAVVTPTDRARWQSVLAGIVIAVATMFVLTILGVAIGASVYDYGDDPNAFGIGAGWWGGISALVAFFVGGWIAARSAAVRGERNGILNGSLVWAGALVLLLWMVGGALSGMLQTTVTTAGNIAGATARTADGTSGGPFGEARQAGDRIVAQATGQNVNTEAMTEEAADRTASAAWWTLLSLVLGLAAAAGGGWMGARTLDDDHRGRAHDTL